LDSRQPRRILFYRIGQIGDTVIALPAIWAIRRYFPKAFMALLYDQHAGRNYPQALRTLPERGLFDEFFSYQANQDGAPLGKIIKYIPQIRRRQFDTLVYLAPRFRSKRQIWRDLVFFRLSGITRFIGHRGMIAFNKLKGEAPLPYLDHEADHLLSRLGRSGIPVPPPGQGCMDLLLTEEEMQGAREWLTNHPGLNEQRILIGMGVGSKFPEKVWPRERFAQLGRYLIDRIAGVPVIFGGPEDRELGNSLINEWRAGANAAGELTVRQAAAVLSFCRLYVGNDTGPMHLAAAVGTRCVGIFSARDFPGSWYPYGPHHIVLRSKVACEGCKLIGCHNDMACLKLISVGDVVKACDKALNDEFSNKHDN
jgi:ADP-heptose:LPS heptosyltransferase